MLEYLEVDESKTKSFYEAQNHLRNEYEKSRKKLHSMFEDNENKFSNDVIWTDLDTMENNISYLFEKFYCTCKTSYKSLVEDEYDKYADRA